MYAYFLPDSVKSLIYCYPYLIDGEPRLDKVENLQRLYC